ncbi:hypothetical protein AB0I37_26515 [Micromonospora purpureochromogenes]|uniref:hypothetical protein n=1 Tax=Micromonospora purpureochromogenes TaxID=47872 RepID=UPI0033FE1EA6
MARAVPPGPRALPLLLLGAVLLTGITLLASDWPDGRPVWRRHAVAALASSLDPYPLLLIIVIFTMLLNIGAPFTALTGNSAINSADSDILLFLAGLLAGLVMGLLLARPNALGYRPGSDGPPPPDGPPGSAGVPGPRRASAERR